MELRPIVIEEASPRNDTTADNAWTEPLSRVLHGVGRSPHGLPDLPDLVAAAVNLATGQREKVLLPLATATAEYALVRAGQQVLVSCYETGGLPDLWQLDRPASLSDLLDACDEASMIRSRTAQSNERKQTSLRLAERVRAAKQNITPHAPMKSRKRTGATTGESKGKALCFGFECEVRPSSHAVSEPTARADAHAMLFQGVLWAFSHGRRVPLVHGPIMLVVQRMVSSTRAVLDAWNAGRTANVRTRSGGLTIGMRLDREGRVSLSLGRDHDALLTIPSLDVSDAITPVLRLASEALRALVSADRIQSRNLRVRDLREEVRGLRKALRARTRTDGFVNTDPDRLRMSAPPSEPEPVSRTTSTQLPTPAGRLRFSERWRVEFDELDASSTFFCGDRLVVASTRRALALCRDTGEVLWVREGLGGPTLMAGQVLVRLSDTGNAELCDVSDGEPFAECRLGARQPGNIQGLFFGGHKAIPMAVLSDGERRLVALDLRNGETKWSFSAKGPGPLRLKRAGRILLVTSGDGAMDAIEVTSGETAWRFSEPVRFCFGPDVGHDIAVVAAGEPGGTSGALFGVDLFSGERLFSHALPGAPTASPIVSQRTAIISHGSGAKHGLLAIDTRSGEATFECSDPGIGLGGAHLTVGQHLIVNTPTGRIRAIHLESGDLVWSQQLAHPAEDAVPRRLEPVLRGGALFVPSSHVHVLRTVDGAPLGPALPCDLVPDVLRVDERGWVYVGEESGHLSALAPVPHLSLVR